MPEAKRKEEKLNLFVTWLVRPLSVLMTIPLINTKVKPTSVTKISVVFSCLSFFLVAFGMTMWIRLIGWLCFFIWACLDGVDGNLARCTNQCSSLGDLWDTMGGYAAMVLILFGSGIAAFFDKNSIELLENYWYLIIGGATAIFSIFPRLIMHKKKSSELNSDAVKGLSDKKSFGLVKITAMNLVSPSGFMQVILLLCIILNFTNFFIVFYFFVTFGVMSLSLYKLLRA
jgi:phosphatidylglycerophosphate synthase